MRMVQGVETRRKMARMDAGALRSLLRYRMTI